MDNLNQWIDDRQSFERARHPQKKKSSQVRLGGLEHMAVSANPSTFLE